MNSVQTYKIFKYLIITFAITYLFWGIDIILSFLGLYEHPGYNAGIVFYIIAVCSPAIAAFIIWQKDPETKGLRHFLKTIVRISNPVIELSLLVIFLCLRFGIPFLFGGAKITGSWWQVVLFIPVMLLFGGVEEVGWRGFLQPVLEKRFGFIAAVLINCFIWTIWHIPLCFIKGTYQYSGNFLWFAFSLLGTAFSLAALRQAKGNILPCILFHAAGNAVLSYGLSVDEGIGAAVSYCAQILFAIIVSCILRQGKSKAKRLSS